MTNDRFDRHMPLFGAEGQAKLRQARVTVVGIGGLGTHVVQQLSLLGIGQMALVDSEELDTSNLNRYIGARHDDPIPGTPKVNIGERIANAIDPDLTVIKIPDSLVSAEAFAAVMKADWVFGCLDSEGARLVLTELCTAYARPYIDLASDICTDPPMTYGGRICVMQDDNGCLVCHGELDLEEAQLELSGPAGQRNREAIYGIQAGALNRSGPSVVSINGVVASLAVTEFMVALTGIRPTKRLCSYRGQLGKVTEKADPALPDCYYCKGIRGTGDRADVQRYIRDGIGAFLR